MMAKDIEIGIASETKAFKQGVETGIIKPVEDATEALEKLGKNKGTEQLEDGFKDAQKASEKLEDQVKDTARTIESAARDSFRDFGDRADDATRKASKGMDNFKDESKQAMRETAASITDVSDGLSLVQEVAANAFVGFGPAAVVGGIAAAVGIGLVSEALETAQEDADKLKERIAQAYKSAAEDGRAFLDEAQITAEAFEILFDQSARERAAKDAAAIGIDLQTMVRALAGDQEALNTAIAAGADAAADARAETEGMVGAQGESLEAYNSALSAAESVNEKLAAQQDLMNQNTEAAATALQLSGEDLIQQQKINDELNNRPKEIHSTLIVDTSQLDAALQNRAINVTVNGYTRDGQRII